MEFDSNRPIYLQICDSVCDRILGGELQPGGRIPSVRDYGGEIGVNPNTVMRSYEKLTDAGIIFNKRGIGFFVSPDAKHKITEYRRNEFLKTELPRFFMQLYTLHIPMDEIDSMYREFIENLTSNPSNQAS